jgi:phosphatidylinositol alpha-1,6-mannosyltransferase
MPTLLIALDFPPMGGGIARFHGAVARRLPGEMIVSTPQDPDAAATDAPFQGAVHRLPVSRRVARTLPGVVLWSSRAMTLARRHRTRFVYCGNLKPAGYPTYWVHRRARIPYGILLCGGELLSEQIKYDHSPFKRRAGRAIFGGAAALIANSRWTADLAVTVMERLGLNDRRSRVQVVHLGTDPDHFRPDLDTTEVRARYHLPDGDRWLLTVARLDPHKGVDTVLQALPAILARAPDVRYAVAGGGPDRDRLERLAQRIGVAERVRFLGEVSEQDLPALYNAAAMYVGASRQSERIGVEGFGIVFVEASASGLPVVGGASGGVPDAVRDGETGFLVPPNDSVAVAAAVSRLLADPTLARRLGTAGRRAVVTHYNWDRVVRDLRAIAAAAS